MMPWIYSAIAIGLISVAVSALDSDMGGFKKLAVISGCAFGIFLLLLEIASNPV